MIIYELHLLNFIKKNVKELREHTGYFKNLGITHLEIMPIHKSSDESVWGYSPISWSELEYGSEEDWKLTIKHLKKNGIECILDVVYNHTSPFKPFDKEVKYLKISGHHTNYSGCGNTVDGHNSKNKTIITSSLLKLKELGFSGFRFDLGSALAYDKYGNYIYDGSVLEYITNHDDLKDMILINEPWTCHGHHKGSLPNRWLEWSDYFRDAVRHYIRCDRHSVAKLMNIINDSSSVNYVTCHDGFTMLDLVSYNEKHNWINGEENRDGTDNNISYNNGFEGFCFDENIINRRKQKITVALTLLMLSKGTPMISAGDEVGKTQRGNNNSYKNIFHFSEGGDYDFRSLVSYLSILRNKIDYSKNIIFCDRNKNEHVDLGDGNLMEFVLKFQLKNGGSKFILINSFSGEVREI